MRICRLRRLSIEDLTYESLFTEEMDFDVGADNLAARLEAKLEQQKTRVWDEDTEIKETFEAALGAHLPFRRFELIAR